MKHKALKIVLPLLLVGLIAISAELTNSSLVSSGENAPLSPDKASVRTVWVRNRSGQGIENIKVIVDCDSERNPPVFITDRHGKAEVKVKAGFTLLRLDAGTGDIRVSIRSPLVEWPCEIVLPTTRIQF